MSKVHKGDVLTIKAGSKKHNIVLHPSYEDFSTNFYMDKTLRNYYCLELVLKNKYGQKLDSASWQISWS